MTSRSAKTILVADDDAERRAEIVRLLRAAEFDVVEAHQVEAHQTDWARAREECSADLVVVDRARFEGLLRASRGPAPAPGAPAAIAERAELEERWAEWVAAAEGPPALLWVEALVDRPERERPELGDEVRRTLARAVRDFERSEGRAGLRVVALGPMSSAVLVPGVGDLERAMRLARRVREALSRAFAAGGAEVTTTVSVGIAHGTADGATLLDQAEVASTCARGRGAGHIEVFSPAMSHWASEWRQMEQDLEQALERGELALHYQPRVDAQTRQVLGVEALLRWSHPTLGTVPPMRFIPIAEQTGAIIPIGEWVLREACRQNRAWQDEGFDPICVSVNLSAVQFRQADLFETVSGVLAETGLENRWLELEVTESTLIDDPGAAVRTLCRLKGAGLHLSLDDFGTGYSSLSYLKSFPIDSLKIDRSFVREIATNPDDASIVTAVILMGHSLNMRVVAEGVETENQLSFLRVLKCDEIQGFLIGRPEPASEVARHFQRSRAGRAA